MPNGKIFCWSCGAQLDYGTKFCQSCGAAASAPPPAQQQPVQQPAQQYVQQPVQQYVQQPVQQYVQPQPVGYGEGRDRIRQLSL